MGDLINTLAQGALWILGLFLAAFMWGREARKRAKAEAERDAMQEALNETRTVRDIARELGDRSDDDLDRVLRAPDPDK